MADRTCDRFKWLMTLSEISLEAVSSVGQISAADWDACANSAADQGSDADPGADAAAETAVGQDPGSGACTASISSYNPFVSHAFFSALEASGSACARTGWGPRHLVAKRDGAVAGIVPCYLKSHSQGEYVFDRGWADAYQRAGGRAIPSCRLRFRSLRPPDRGF